MKLFNLLALAFVCTFAFTSCNDDDNNIETLTGTNTVKLEFDNSFNGDDLVLGSSYTNSNGETLTIDEFNYIVSNFVLVAEDGTEYTYPKNDSYNIINEGKGNVSIELTDIPAGTYTGIKFGIGVDMERYLEGQAAQEEFWTKAQDNGMTWSWQAGYKFVVLEGNYTSETVTTQKQYKLHIASRGSTVNLYKTVSLSMDEALVSSDKSPQLHIVTDASKMLTGSNSIKLSEGATIMGGDKATLIADNDVEMFTVHHVHNGSGSHHHP